MVVVVLLLFVDDESVVDGAELDDSPAGSSNGNEVEEVDAKG